LAAVKLGIPVAHVEAGLRSFNMSMPEEVNRIVTDRISRWLFAPTDAAVAHLMREGADGARVFLVGDVMYDVSLHHGKRVNPGEGAMSALGLVAGRYVLATIHRAENTNRKDRLSAIVDGLLELSRNLVVVWPIHPRTRAVLRDIGKLRSVEESLRLIDPLGYLEMVRLEKYAGVIATDSGGVQKEAFFHRVPCITLRDETEWVELIESGWNRLVPPISGRVICQSILSAVGRVGANVNPYGNGYAARRIVHELSRV
jgi:UDP-GlcNAc3NAcA epimerase